MRRRLTFLICVVAIGVVGVAAPAFADSGGGGHSPSVQFSSTGSGTYTSGGTPGCQFGGQCTATSQGTTVVTAGSTTFPATFSASTTVDYSKVVFPSPTTYCAPASGTVTITSTAKATDQIFKTEQGTVCAGTGTGASHTFSGTYVITGGSGQFAGATGSGTAASQDNGGATITSATENGTISYRGAKSHGQG
jgi:hypothetical protein